MTDPYRIGFGERAVLLAYHMVLVPLVLLNTMYNFNDAGGELSPEIAMVFNWLPVVLIAGVILALFGRPFYHGVKIGKRRLQQKVNSQ